MIGDTIDRSLDFIGVVFHDFVGDFSIKVSVEGVNGSLNGRNFLCLLVGNIKAEIFLHRHHQLHRVQRIKAQFLKSGTSRKLGLVALSRALQNLKDLSLYLLQKSHLGGV